MSCIIHAINQQGEIVKETFKDYHQFMSSKLYRDCINYRLPKIVGELNKRNKRYRYIIFAELDNDLNYKPYTNKFISTHKIGEWLDRQSYLMKLKQL